MRGLLLAAVACVALLVAIPATGPSHARTTASSPSLGADPSAVPIVAPDARAHPPTGASISSWLNASVDPTLLGGPLASPVPVSALPETPPPWTPSTSPTVMTFLAASRTCCVYTNFTAPTGPWATILLNYTGEVVAGVYDSSYRAYIDGVQVLFGTTPEYGTWTVLQNLSEYRTLFNGTTNLTFILGAAVTSGYFLNTVSLEFYPLPSKGRIAAAPDLVVPLWSRQFVRSTSPTITANATVPTNVTAAVLEMYVYGFGPDEFWWSTAPPLRVVQFGVGTQTLGALMPFPYINTGGIDLFLWRPITADFTIDDRPYQLNVSGDLGTIEGYHTYWANITGWTPGSTWMVGGSLLLWTNATVVSATQGSVYDSGLTISGSGVSQSGHVAFGSSSTLMTQTGPPLTISSSANESFTAVGASAPSWQNLTQTTSFAQSTSTANGSATITEDRTWTFPVSVDLGQQVVITSTTNGSFPETANFTTYMLNTYQEWNEQRRVTWAHGPVTAVVDQQVVDDQLGGANGVFGGTERLTSPNAALITSITLISSATEKEYTQTSGPPSAAQTYTHLLVGSSYQPPGPYNAETVTTDATKSQPFPLIASVALPTPATDLGSPLTLLAEVHGGFGPYAFVWSGLPPGCAAPNLGQVTCSPTAAGSFSVDLEVTDAQGNTAPLATGSVYVAPTPNATLVVNRTQFDVGQAVDVSASVVGGVAPFACTWYEAGVAQGPATSCASAFSFIAQSTGPTVVGAWLQDGTGAQFWAANVTLTVGAPLSAGVTGSGSLSSVVVGHGVELTAQPAGGVGPYTWVWTLDSATIVGSGGSTFTFVPNSTGTFSLSATVTDAAGDQATSSPVSVTVVNGTGPSSAGSGSSGIPVVWFWAIVGATIAELFVILVLAARRARPPQRLPPPRAYGPPRISPDAPVVPPSPPP